MHKPHFPLAGWQWRAFNPTHLGLQLIAVPLLIIASLLIVSGALNLNLADISIGIIAVFASLGLLRQPH
ncbi:hypothetical protein E3Z27_08510 [Pseudomonas mediterranea]|uniref:Terminase n=1 Tax=Pseudomonas mediterranea TaxID=183795 RepID=A0AAX2DGY5_9PSED|nr:hypothetical protein [Pseudomonas mediterranea]MBL0843372.1 hypothetical protein [Pseudomonas mediterranea]MDU9029233.1 hypothetical protein [Pseudomonas mediterranea]QHA81726.1 hypothetical protein E3Z27_08510 [Pseudomonas mediterranea]UZE02659.1 hypothetical protein LOY71_08560 [Pseudomonas mediterranea]CAH0320319.1 hypothetical protein SRABI112_05284 [Pseudomonas mediterranea]